jgi:hypothetical protein
MSGRLTLEQVEQLAEQLPLQEQLILINKLIERLAEIVPSFTAVNKKKRSQEISAILQECDEAAEAFARIT